MKARTVRGDLQTAVDVWGRRSDDRVVTLIGMVHVGDRDYYDRVADMVDKRERAGAVVHYERMAPIPDGSDATGQELDWYGRMRAVGHHGLLADLIGAQFQMAALPPKPHWVNTDIDALELLRSLPDPERFVAKMERAGRALDDDMTDDQRQFLSRTVGALVRHMPRFYPLVTASRFFSGQARGVQDVIIDRRNQVAIDAALAETRPVVALWGAGHLPGIGHGLQVAGFELVATKWFTAVRKPRGAHTRERRRPLLEAVEFSDWSDMGGD